jgi:GAF domain-containing protein
MDELHRRLAGEVDKALSRFSAQESLMPICEILDQGLEHFDWTGFYLMEDGELVLGPFIGLPTEHTHIQVGRGVCGRAAAEKNTIVIDDVTNEENYLACSLGTRSELVVPIMKGDEVLGEIDIDSDRPSAFMPDDSELLEYIAAQLAKQWAEEKPGVFGQKSVR